MFIKKINRLIDIVKGGRTATRARLPFTLSIILFSPLVLSAPPDPSNLPTTADIPVLLLALCCMLAFCFGFQAGNTR